MLPRSFGPPATATGNDIVSFFLVGDTHYRTQADEITRLDGTSASHNARLVEWMNKLPGTPFSAQSRGRRGARTAWYDSCRRHRGQWRQEAGKMEDGGIGNDGIHWRLGARPFAKSPCVKNQIFYLYYFEHLL
jgi:hypothetical protein